jgi:hypothetical protein
MTELVLLIAGLLADEHDLRAALPLAEHRLGRVSPEVAGPAALGGATELGERRARRKPRVALLIH